MATETSLFVQSVVCCPGGMYLLLVFLLLATLVGRGRTEDRLPGATCLRELPMERLLYIKREFSQDNWGKGDDEDDEDDDRDVVECPEAQALVMRQQPAILMDRGGGGHHHGYHGGWHHKSPSYAKPSKKSRIVSKVFQGTITALAFLAFGGYLLCIIIRAFRQKSANVNVNVNGTTMTGRRKRDVASVLVSWPNSPWDAMFAALMSLSQGYAAYHEIPLQEQDFDDTLD